MRVLKGAKEAVRKGMIPICYGPIQSLYYRHLTRMCQPQWMNHSNQQVKRNRLPA